MAIVTMIEGWDGKYTVKFETKKKREAMAVKKVCLAIREHKVKGPDDVIISCEQEKEENK